MFSISKVTISLKHPVTWPPCIVHPPKSSRRSPTMIAECPRRGQGASSGAWICPKLEQNKKQKDRTVKRVSRSQQKQNQNKDLTSSFGWRHNAVSVLKTHKSAITVAAFASLAITRPPKRNMRFPAIVKLDPSRAGGNVPGTP